MKTLLGTALFTSVFALSACSAPKTDSASPAPAASSNSAADPAPTATPTDPAPAAGAMPEMTPAQHAAMETDASAKSGDMKGMDVAGETKSGGAMESTTDAGWYTAGMFRACGSAKAMKVDKSADIDKQIKAGGIGASDPVYVKLEGMAMGNSYMLTKVSQVGSKTPVRDCPMTGTTTQAGG